MSHSNAIPTYMRMHLTADKPASVFVCLRSRCADGAKKKKEKKEKKKTRMRAADPLFRDNLSHKTGVDINTPFNR